jgi:hypothetical protein
VSRWTSSLNEAAADGDGILGCFLLDLAFDSGHVRVNDAGFDLPVGANTYVGVGAFGDFDGVEESVEFVARGVRYTLSGIDTGLISTIRTEKYKRRAGTLYVAMLTEQRALVDTPEIVWSGYMDTMQVEVSGASSQINLQCEHRLRNAPPFSRFSDADQKARSAGDRGFDLTHLVAGYKSTWGGRGTTWGPKPGGGYGPG